MKNKATKIHFVQVEASYFHGTEVSWLCRGNCQREDYKSLTPCFPVQQSAQGCRVSHRKHWPAKTGSQMQVQKGNPMRRPWQTGLSGRLLSPPNTWLKSPEADQQPTPHRPETKIQGNKGGRGVADSATENCLSLVVGTRNVTTEKAGNRRQWPP